MAKKPTVSGKPLPRGQEHLVGSRMTDQGIRRRNREKKAEHGTVRVTDRLDNQIEAYDAAQGGAIQPWEGPNPLEEAAAPVRKPGFRQRFLSPTVIEKRGTRGFQFVHDEKGRQVKVGRLMLAEMPEERARRRDAHYQEEGNEALREAQENYQVQQEKAIRDGRGVGLAPLQVGEIVRDSRDRSRVVTTGLHSVRGNSATV